MPTATILEPLTGDTVVAPVVVQAGYTTAALFKMKCSVGTTNAVEQTHTPPPNSAVHMSSGVSVAANNYTVFANDTTGAPAELDNQPNVSVLGAGLTPPVTIDPVTGPVPPPAPPAPPAPVARAKKEKHVKGECRAGAAYVICKVYEINLTTKQRTVIAAGADTVKTAGGKLTYFVKVEPDLETTDDNLQYVARVSAFDKDGNALGTATKSFAK